MVTVYDYAYFSGYKIKVTLLQVLWTDEEQENNVGARNRFPYQGGKIHLCVQFVVLSFAYIF